MNLQLYGIQEGQLGKIHQLKSSFLLFILFIHNANWKYSQKTHIHRIHSQQDTNANTYFSQTITRRAQTLWLACEGSRCETPKTASIALWYIKKIYVHLHFQVLKHSWLNTSCVVSAYTVETYQSIKHVFNSNISYTKSKSNVENHYKNKIAKQYFIQWAHFKCFFQITDIGFGREVTYYWKKISENPNVKNKNKKIISMLRVRKEIIFARVMCICPLFKSWIH